MEQKFEVLNRALKLKNQQLEELKGSIKCPFEKRHEWLENRIEGLEEFLKNLHEKIETIGEKIEKEEEEAERIEENLENNIKHFKGIVDIIYKYLLFIFPRNIIIYSLSFHLQFPYITPYIYHYLLLFYLVSHSFLSYLFPHYLLFLLENINHIWNTISLMGDYYEKNIFKKFSDHNP